MNAPSKIEKPASLLAALPAALASVDHARKVANNPHFKSKYADMGAVIDAIRPIADHGIWFRQVDLEREGGAAVETFYIGHGEQLSAGVTFVPADRANAQGYGSAKTYARRYGLQTAFGLASEDDDGNAAAAAPPKKAARLSDNDWSEIVQLIEATSTDTGKLCSAYKVESLKELTPEQAGNIKGILNKRLAEQAKKEKADA